MDTAKAVTHLADGQLCLCLWQVRHTDMHPDMHNPYGNDADMYVRFSWLSLDAVVRDVMMPRVYQGVEWGPSMVAILYRFDCVREQA